MAILSGASSHDAGELRWEGCPVVFRGVSDAQALGIAIVHQEPQLIACLSVAENLRLGRLPSRSGVLRLVDRGALGRDAGQAIARVGLHLPPATIVSSLSPAQRQLVAIARALSRGARLLILDEPTSSLGDADSRRLLDLLRELRAGGTAVLYISHRLEELRAIANRVTVLRDGRVAATGPLDSLTNDDLIHAMSGRPLRAATAHPGGTNPDAAPVLSVRGVTRTGRLPDITLDVAPGEIVGIAGLMGSGRSRLLRTLFGEERLDSGTVDVRTSHGARRIDSIAAATAAGIGFVPEDRRRLGLVPTASVVENIGLATPPGTRTFGMLRHGRLRSIAGAAARLLHVKAPSLDHPITALSGGNQQKVVLARWLAAGARVLLLDEPTRGVDITAKAEIHAHLRRLAAEGLSLIVVSSELPELMALCTRICVMRVGRIVADLPRASATQPELVRLAIGDATRC